MAASTTTHLSRTFFPRPSSFFRRGPRVAPPAACPAPASDLLPRRRPHPVYFPRRRRLPPLFPSSPDAWRSPHATLISPSPTPYLLPLGAKGLAAGRMPGALRPPTPAPSLPPSPLSFFPGHVPPLRPPHHLPSHPAASPGSRRHTASHLQPHHLAGRRALPAPLPPSPRGAPPLHLASRHPPHPSWCYLLTPASTSLVPSLP